MQTELCCPLPVAQIHPWKVLKCLSSFLLCLHPSERMQVKINVQPYITMELLYVSCTQNKNDMLFATDAAFCFHIQNVSFILKKERKKERKKETFIGHFAIKMNSCRNKVQVPCSYEVIKHDVTKWGLNSQRFIQYVQKYFGRHNWWITLWCCRR